MNQGRSGRAQFLSVARWLLAGVLLPPCPLHAQAQQDVVVQLDASKVSPRSVEDATKRRIIADYRMAWTSLAQAYESRRIDALPALFVGPAKQWTVESVASQKKSGVSIRYLDQHHKLQAVFYAPEGDLIELHDTVDYRMQALDGSSVVYDDHVTAHYVVLMTPGADRWVVRQLQSAPQF